MRLSPKLAATGAAILATAGTVYLLTTQSDDRTLTFAPTLTDVFRGEMPSLEWQSTGYDRCFAPSENAAPSQPTEWFGDKPTSGIQQVGPIRGRATFRIVCAAGDETTQAEATINVVAKPCGKSGTPPCRGGRFDQSCSYSHSNFDDPVVFFGKPGASHEHDYIGFDSTDAFSSYDTMISHVDDDPIPTSCTEFSREDGAPAPNVSGYWSPSLQVCAGTAPDSSCTTVRPVRVHVYYQSPNRSRVTVSPAPGFEQIAGNKSATREEAKKTGAVHWFCHGKKNANGAELDGYTVDTIPSDCPRFGSITAEVVFPTCWNGEKDSPTHNTHVVYRQDDGTCPDDHPLILPRIVSEILFPIQHVTGHRLRLTDTIMLGGCAPGQTECAFADLHGRLGMWQMHQDYLYAWKQSRLDKLLHECLNAGIRTGVSCSRKPPS